MEKNIQRINEIADKLNIPNEYLEKYGEYKAKISDEYYKKIESRKNAKLILVTAINPTPQGEGKTTQSIGLVQGLSKLNKNVIAVLREPSLGPVFGVKGGAVGGGKSSLMPASDIDLHFTGDFHAITSANNLLCASLDNHIFQGNSLNIDSEKICIKRAIDMNDRGLRQITLSDGQKTGFEITAACEVMAICCLANDYDDLKVRLGNILVAYDINNNPIYARQLNVVNALMAILKDALKPNLVQTTENVPCLVHLGPFANIAHGCNSVVATKLGLKLADYCVTEAGFGADLGAEKFLDIKCTSANLVPDAIMIVATVRALKYNGDENSNTELEKLKSGMKNLNRHIENLKMFNVPLMVCINKFDNDTDEELDLIYSNCKNLDVEVEMSSSFENGGTGAIKLASKMITLLENTKTNFKPLYSLDSSIKEKINEVCTKIYRASKVNFSDDALKNLEQIDKLKLNNLPICIAKTPSSFSDNPKLLGAPENFEVTVKKLKINNGAKFIVAYLGDILTMPGLGKTPKYEKF